MKTCVIGGGLMGMALADKLAADGASVTVVETSPQVGGLATWHDFGGFFWDRFYHVILPTDRHLIQFVSDIGLSKQLEWRRTYTGFYVDGAMHSISSNMEFLKFPLLSLTSKVRLALTMLYCARIDDWKRLESETAEAFLLRASGQENYEKLWRPLLLAKLGENYKRVSAVFIWSYIKRLFSARDKSASAEHLGHVSGGYRMIFERFENELSQPADRSSPARASTRCVLAKPMAYVWISRITVARTAKSSARVPFRCFANRRRGLAAGESLRQRGRVPRRSLSGHRERSSVGPVLCREHRRQRDPFTGMIGTSTVIDTKNTAVCT